MKRLLTLVLFAASLAPAAAAQTKTIQGRVVGVADGDTITILDSTNTQHRIRCQGIDAPEKAQDFGEAAKQKMSELAFGKQAAVSHDKTDRYGRVVGKIVVDGQDVCGQMVFSGLAWHYKQYEGEQSEQDRQLYAAAERRAKASRSGLWSQPAPTPPWEFRKSKPVDEAAEDKAAPIAPTASVATDTATAGGIVGNSNSRIYHWPGCPNYNDIKAENRVPFASNEEAKAAGYRAARNCPNAEPDAKEANTADTAAPSSSGGTVNVRGYYRKDGTYVKPHTRRAPRRRP